MEESEADTDLERKIKNKVPKEIFEGVKNMNKYAECL